MIDRRGDPKAVHEWTRKQTNREWTRMNANRDHEWMRIEISRRGKTDEPRMNQPSREAETVGTLERCLACEAETVGTLERCLACEAETVGTLERCLACEAETVGTLERCLACEAETVGTPEALPCLRSRHSRNLWSDVKKIHEQAICS
jgi:hypothetical protein